jgi:DNA-binding YbaB/EbfC family protein
MRGLGNLGGMGSMGNLMKQAQKAMQQMQQLQEELAAQRVQGSAGGGMVCAEVTGQGSLESISIDPEVVDPADVEMLQDLVVSAVRDAMQKAEQIKEERMKELTGGFGLPGGMF